MIEKLGQQITIGCREENTDLLDVIRKLSVDKELVYDGLKTLVFEEYFTKADLFYFFGAIANEMELFLESNKAINSSISLHFDSLRELAVENFDGFPFDKSDLLFYFGCRNCITDFQRLLVQIERNFWRGTFSVLEGIFGKNWIAGVSPTIRKKWASFREDYRTSADELPLHEFSSLPDLRDIICASGNWKYFALHLPHSMSDKREFKSRITTTLIPIRNRIFHPTRSIGLSYTDYIELVKMAKEVSINNWRDLERFSLPNLYSELPVPKTY